MFLFVCTRAFGQGEVMMQIQQVDSAIAHPVLPVQRFNNLSDAFQYLQDWQQRLLREGHLSASVDSFYFQDSLWQALLFTGPRYQWTRLQVDSLPVALLQNLGWRDRDWTNKPVHPEKLADLQHQILRYCDNNGYPFARTSLQVIDRESGGLAARLLLAKGPYTRIDSIVVEGEVSLTPAFLFNYLELHPGDPYDESQIRKISKKLRELDFVEEERPWEMHFTIGKNTLYLFLKEKKANQFNALVGLQPNTEATQRFMLTADMLLSLKNSFGMGEHIAASFQNLQFQSPRLHLETLLPFVMGTRFGLDAAFDLYKRDTTFVRISFEAGIRYQLSAQDYLRVSYQQLTNRMISFNEIEVIQRKMLPDNVDMQTKGLVMHYVMSHTDYRLNPRRGWEAALSLSGAWRMVRENPAVTGIVDGSGYDYRTLYDSAGIRVFQYRVEAVAAYYIPLGKQFALKLAYDGGYMGGSPFFQNELYQIGGFRRLRGFDEQSIFANQYHIGTTELRLLLAGDTRLFIFADQAYVQTQYGQIRDEGFPLGLGAGINLDTGNGIFNLTVGMGKRSGQGFQFRQAKIHFGYVAYF